MLGLKGKAKGNGIEGLRNPKVPQQRCRRKGKGQRQNEMITWMRGDPPDNLSFPGLSIFWLGIGSHLGHHCLYGLNDKKEHLTWSLNQRGCPTTIKRQLLPSFTIFFFFKLQISDIFPSPNYVRIISHIL